MQVALAYSGTSSDGGLAPTSHGSPSHDLVASPSNPRLSVPNVLNLVASSTTPPPTSEPCPPTGAKFFHVFLDLRAFVANPCAPGETAELYFSLFNKTDARYVTEDYCVILNHNGAPARETEGRLLKMRTLFRDLSQHDVQDQIFLVCRIVKNGSIKLVGGSSLSASTSHGYLSAPSISRSETASFDSSTSQTGVDYGFGTSSGMLTTDRSGRQSYRRPFGCAVLEISQFNKLSADATTVSQEYQMPVFIPANEAAFSTLHEDIISSRIKEIEKSPRADHLAVNVRILYGETSVLVKDNPTLFSDVPLTSRLGFSDVVFPGDQRNEVYLKLWSGDFSNGGTSRTTRGLAQLAAGAGAKNLEVTAEVRTRDGVLVPGVISRGSGEPMVSQYMSMVFRSNNTPSASFLPRSLHSRSLTSLRSQHGANSSSWRSPPSSWSSATSSTPSALAARKIAGPSRAPAETSPSPSPTLPSSSTTPPSSPTDPTPSSSTATRSTALRPSFTSRLLRSTSPAKRLTSRRRSSRPSSRCGIRWSCGASSFRPSTRRTRRSSSCSSGSRRCWRIRRSSRTPWRS